MAEQAREIPVIEFYPGPEKDGGGKFRVLDVVIDVKPLPEDLMARRFIPPWETMVKTVCWDTPTALLARDLIVRVTGKIPTRIEGPTGTSKTFTTELVAAVARRNYLRHNYSRQSDPGDTIGRFVPSDRKLDIRLDELLTFPLSEGGHQIVETAIKQNRRLTEVEEQMVAKDLGISLHDGGFIWQNGSLVGSAIYGSFYVADESNLAPGNVTERENSALEKRATLRVSEHLGEIVRTYTTEEKAIVDAGGIIPGVEELHPDFLYIAAQNPWGIGGGRFEESGARRNRLQDRIMDALEFREYEEYLNFLIHGNNPDIVWQNRKYKGEKNMSTAYRNFEQDMASVPNADVALSWLAQFQIDLQNLTAIGKIGSEKDIKGGSYEYTRRNFERFLDSFQSAKSTLLDTQELFRTGDLVYSTNWHDLFMEALYQEYLSGMYREDANLVKELVKASGIEDKLGPSRNNPALPGWVKRAQSQGIQVEMAAGEWVLRRASVEAGINLDELLEEIQRERFNFSEDNDTIKVSTQRPLATIMELFTEMELKALAQSQAKYTEAEDTSREIHLT